MRKHRIIFLFVVISQVSILATQFSFGLLFETRSLNEQEKNIAEKDYFSIIQKCYDRLEAKEDSGEVCDAFIGYYINQCAALDNLLSYCDVDYFDNEFVNPVRDYEFTRHNQQGCIKQNQTFMDLVFCEDYINIPGEGERRFLKTVTDKSHLIIPSATLFTDEYNSQVFGEIMNNYSYPIDSTQILARFNYTNGSALGFDHTYTQDSIIQPGDKSGFWFFFENPLPKSARFGLTSEFQRANVSLPEKLLLTVTYPSNKLPGTESLGKNNASEKDIGITPNIFNDSSFSENNSSSNATLNATKMAMEHARDLLEATREASNATHSPPTIINSVNSVGNPPNKIDKISGNITNLGNTTATNVQINAIFYDASGKVIDIDSEYVNIGIGLLAGKSQSFSIEPLFNYDYREKIVDYELNAESSEYSMISGP